jgi:hypothetical protein
MEHKYHADVIQAIALLLEVGIIAEKCESDERDFELSVWGKKVIELVMHADEILTARWP